MFYFFFLGGEGIFFLYCAEGSRWLPFIKITGVIMGQNIGKNIRKDVKDFILNQQLSGYRFTSNDLDGKAEEYIASMANQYGIKLYIAK